MADPERADPVKTIVQIAGLLAGVLALLYALGGGVLALRLFFVDLPSVTIVPQLPREFLVSLALTQVALPAAAVAGVYLAFRLAIEPHAPHRFVARAPAAVMSAFLALATAVVGAAILGENEPWPYTAAWLAIASIVVFAVCLVAFALRAKLARRFVGPTWNRTRPIAAMTLIAGLWSTPAWVILGAGFHFLDAKVCMTTGSPRTGVLVGETSDRVYIGEKAAPDGPRRIESLPLEQVKAVYIGGEADSKKC